MDNGLRYYENPDTGATFGFGLPLPASIADQIKAGQLRRCDPPEDAAPASPDTESSSMADDDDEVGGDAGAATELEPELVDVFLPEPEPVVPEKPRRGGRRPV